MKAASKMHPDDERRLEAIKVLVRAHSKLEDKPTGVLWLPEKRRAGVTLLEIVPTMPEDSRAGEPIEFLPSRGFRYALRLITGRAADLKAAIERDEKLAQAVVDGVPIPEPTSATKSLQALAKKIVKQAG
jgi:hypothetical protein